MKEQVAITSDEDNTQQRTSWYAYFKNVYQSIKKTYYDDLQQHHHPRPFHLVLIDLHQAAHHKKIHCVEKPLAGTHDLSFVALSYRWGEVPETMVDTGVGYVATIKSFDLDSFFTLCKAITQEADLHSLRYVWVDAICIHQTNHMQRKATIYHMAQIYERANYILAVPDLHLAYLKASNSHHRHVITGSTSYGRHLYHLLHNHTQPLMELDHQFFDIIKVNSPFLRYLLSHYTHHFTLGWTTPVMQHSSRPYYDDDAMFHHIYETAASASASTSTLNVHTDDTNTTTSTTIDQWHTCHFSDECPLKQFNIHSTNPPLPPPSSFTSPPSPFTSPSSPYDQQQQQQTWKKNILYRSERVRQSIEFMSDLVVDWATRVWVISEYHIAKTKHPKMKYWFIQLGCLDDYDYDYDITMMMSGQEERKKKKPIFFEFDFLDQEEDGTATTTATMATAMTMRYTRRTYGILRPFRTTMRQQLGQQTFLEMILKSKASRHEDRFHAILPSSSDYKYLMNDPTRVHPWQDTTIHTLTNVKLELYQWMTKQHQLQLLFLSNQNQNQNHHQLVLPTFATSTIEWPDSDSMMLFNDPTWPTNFDLSSSSTSTATSTSTSTSTLPIQLLFDTTPPPPPPSPSPPHHHRHQRQLLRIRPREYYSFRVKTSLPQALDYRTTLYHLLGVDMVHVDLMIIPAFTMLDSTSNNKQDDGDAIPTSVYDMIFLMGASSTNQWLLTPFPYGKLFDPWDDPSAWQLVSCHHDHSGFDIY